MLNLTCRDIVPVWGKELIVTQLYDLEQLLLVTVLAAKRGKTAEQNVKDHTSCPHIYFQPIA